MLDQQELQVALAIVRATPAGRYTVRQLFGDAWQLNGRPRAYGQWFKASVKSGQLPGVRWVGQKSDRSQLYEVEPKS